MAIDEGSKKEIWNTNKITEELHSNLITTMGADGLRKYEEKARFLLYRIPIWKDQKTEGQQLPVFTIEIKDITEKVKEQIASVSCYESCVRSVVVESVSRLFENLGPKEKDYFNKSVRHLLKVRFI